MNGLTKDNLYVLLKAVRLCEIDHGECPDLDNVKFKLLKMIDEYCEHKEEYEDFNYQPMRCKDCREITG